MALNAWTFHLTSILFIYTVFAWGASYESGKSNWSPKIARWRYCLLWRRSYCGDGSKTLITAVCDSSGQLRWVDRAGGMDGDKNVLRKSCRKLGSDDWFVKLRSSGLPGLFEDLAVSKTRNAEHRLCNYQMQGWGDVARLTSFLCERALMYWRTLLFRLCLCSRINVGILSLFHRWLKAKSGLVVFPGSVTIPS